MRQTSNRNWNRVVGLVSGDFWAGENLKICKNPSLEPLGGHSLDVHEHRNAVVAGRNELQRPLAVTFINLTGPQPPGDADISVTHRTPDGRQNR